MLTIPGHKGNANQNHTKIPLHSLKLLPSTTQTTTNVGEDAGEKEPSYTVGGNVSLCNHYGKQFGGFLKN
jgi:hypothetical protein